MRWFETTQYHHFFAQVIVVKLGTTGPSVRWFKPTQYHHRAGLFFRKEKSQRKETRIKNETKVNSVSFFDDYLLVPSEGLEPTTLCSEDRCSNPLSYDGLLVRPIGVGPTTFSSGNCRSIQLSYGRIYYILYHFMVLFKA